jgi:Uncharacterized alpha/beta hydrolase domain (DUF2235)
MANDAIAASLAANRDVPNSPPGPFQDCRDVIHLAVFFDGTGNNEDEDEPTKKWSNVARIFRSARLFSLADKTKTTYPIYISGVGTPYNGKPVRWLSAAGVWIQDGKLGGGAGAGGDRRLDQGDDAVNDRLRDVLIANAKTMGGEVGKYAATGSAKSFAEVNAALGKHRLIKVINLSIFGFSRGAALARAFSNRVLENCKQEGDELLYNGYTLRLNFMGIFDTVASFGVPAANVQLPFWERDLVLSPKIERCVHYVAAHEVRFSFPVDLIRKKGQFANPNWEEKTYPGVHSDVGGGYIPVDQGINNNYARIPMRDMMREALTGGVRMLGYEEIKKTRFSTYQERFECKPETETAYKAYMSACGPLAGTIEKQMVQHMKALYSACGTMHRTGLQTPAERSVAAGTRSAIGYSSMAREIEIYRDPAKAGKWVRLEAEVRGFAQFVQPQAWQIDAWDVNASKGAVGFVSQFVHDSKLNISEPFSYFKPRGVDESTVNIWQEGGRWLGGKATAVGNAVETGYDATKNATIRAADYTATKAVAAGNYTKDKATEAANYTARKAKEGSDYASQKAHEAELEAERIYDKGTHWVKSTKDEIVQETGQAIDATKQQAGKLYDKTADTVKSAKDEVVKESNSLFNATKKLFGY